MKALIVIDLPDNLNKAIEEIRVDIKANLYGNEILDWRNQLIKPMPKKAHIYDMYKDYPIKTAEEEVAYFMGNEDGWNDCIDVLLGEEE